MYKKEEEFSILRTIHSYSIMKRDKISNRLSVISEKTRVALYSGSWLLLSQHWGGDISQTYLRHNGAISETSVTYLRHIWEIYWTFLGSIRDIPLAYLGGIQQHGFVLEMT